MAKGRVKESKIPEGKKDGEILLQLFNHFEKVTKKKKMLVKLLFVTACFLTADIKIVANHFFIFSHRDPKKKNFVHALFHVFLINEFTK